MLSMIRLVTVLHFMALFAGALLSAACCECLAITATGQRLRKHLAEVFRELARRQESRIEEGHLMLDHAHLMISSPPK